MKTKRITMLIEAFIFAICIALAYYFIFESNLSDQMNSLLCNLAIGLSTGGMIAFLIEIPSYYAAKKQIETVLCVNLQYIYMYLAQLKSEVENRQLNPNQEFTDKFSEYHFKRIIPLVFSVLSVDSSVYFCHSKHKEIVRLQKELNLLALSVDAMVAPLTIKSTSIALNAKHMGNVFQIINSFLEPELTSFLAEIKTYIKTIDDIMQILCNKKQLKVWNIQINSIKDALDKGNMDLQKSEK